MTQKANKIHYYYIYTTDLLMTQKASKIHYYYIYNGPVDDPESQQDTLPYILIQTCWWPWKPERHTTII